MSDLPVVLLAFANDYDPDRRLENLSSERNQIVRSLKIAEENELCQVEIIVDANFENVVDAFRKPKFKDRIAVFHFAGHADDYGLCLESLQGNPEYILAEGFAQFLGQQHNLKMVFLNGCATSDHAIHLHEKKVPIVISTKREVKDDLAALMAINFYKFLASDSTILRSFIEAEGVIKSMDVDWSILSRGLGLKNMNGIVSDWKMSINEDLNDASLWCFSKAKNDPLFSLPKVESHISPFDPFVGFRPYTNDDFNIFWGRDYEIKGFYELLQEQSQPSIAICHGVKGVGKTSFLSAGIIPRLESGEYFVRSIYLNESTTYSAFKDELKKYLDEKKSIKGKGFIFLFGLSEKDKLYVEEIAIQFQKTTLQITFILELTNAILNEWQSLFNSFRLSFYQLLPFNQKSIDSIFLKLSIDFKIEADSKFKETISSLILSDAKSGSTPLLQYTLSSLLQKAKKSDLNTSTLDMNLLTEWNSLIGFTSYIKNQLSKIDKEFSDSGIALEILNDCTRDSKLDSLPKISELSKKYNLEISLFERLIDQLKANYLLSEPVSKVGGESSEVRLYHNILAHPLKDIIDNSYAPAQEVRRFCRYRVYNDKPFEQNEIQLINRNKSFVKKLNSDEQELLNFSIASNNDLKKRKKYQTIFKYTLLAVILFLGIFLNSPYLLMYIILLFVFYVF